MPTILIVEDEAHIRQFVAINLRARGYETLTAECAEDGIELLKAGNRPQVLILDIKLPGMSGWDMLNMIDHDSELPKLPVIVMTASSVLSQPNEYMYTNIVEKLNKPVSVAELMRAVNSVFND